MEPDEVMAKIAQHVADAHASLEAAEALAMEHDMAFSFSPAYGMGGYFDGEEGEWTSSSQN